jgi:hypothetical protein
MDVSDVENGLNTDFVCLNIWSKLIPNSSSKGKSSPSLSVVVRLIDGRR